jgi:HEAT repeat protein
VTTVAELLQLLERGARTVSPSEPGQLSPREWLAEARRQDWTELDAAPSTESTRERAAEPPSRRHAEAVVGGLAAARARRLALGRSTDISTLQAAARCGTLLEQRAALARLQELAKNTGATVPGFEGTLFEPELERDLLACLAEGSGAAAREARTTLAQVDALLERVEQQVRSVVDGSEVSDPLGRLDPDEQAQLLLHLRSASSFVLGFVMDCLLESLERGDIRDASRRLVAWRAAADPRLLPTLSGILLDNPDSALRAEAARALARIDDARVGPALQLAYQTASAREERIALIEAFGLQGEARDSQFLREALEAYVRETATEPSDASAAPSSRTRAQGHVGLVAALDAIFDPELVEPALRLVTHPHAEVQRAAIRAIGRAGEDNALAWLDRLQGQVPPGLQGELEAAEASILGRAELRGDRPEDLRDVTRRAARKRALARKFSRGLDVPPTKRHRFVAWLLFLRAQVAVLFGARETASELCERAYQADPGWHLPPWLQGRIWWRAGDATRAITGFRRALPLAPDAWVRQRRWITPIVQCFVLRAESLLREGHGVRAQRLLDELWPYDLSRAASPVRLALRRCRQHLALPAGPENALGAPAWSGDTGPGRDTLERIDGGHQGH